MRKNVILLAVTVAALSACQIYPPTERPDYTIKVVQKPDGQTTALPPQCPSWATSTTDPYDNQPVPQFGCANARNLALMVERPEDLTHPRPLDNSSGVMAVGSMRRYYNNQTRGLLDPDSAPDASLATTTAPTAASPMTGDNALGGGSSAAAPSSLPSATPVTSGP